MLTHSVLLKFWLIAVVSVFSFDGSSATKTDQAPRDPIYAMLRQNESLIVFNVLQAEANTEKAFELARQIGDPGILKAVELDLEVVKGLINGSLRESDFHQLALELQNWNTIHDPQLVFHSHYVVALASLMHDESGANLKLTLDGMRRVAETTKDQSLSGRYKWLELFIGLCYANRYFEEPTDEEVAQLIKTLPDDLDWNSQSMNRLNQLIKANRDAVDIKDANQTMVTLSAATNRLLTLKLLEAKGHVLLQNNKSEDAISLYKQVVEISRSLGCPRVTLALDRKLFLLKAEFSQLQDFGESEVAVLSNPAYQNLSIVSEHDTKMMMQEWVNRVGTPKDCLPISTANGYPQKDTQEHLRQTATLNQSYNRLLDERRQSEVQLQNVKLANQTIVESQNLTLSRLRIYSIVATLSFLAMLPCLFLFLQRKRINVIKHELVTEQHRAQASEAKVDGLTNRLVRIERMNSLGLMAGGIAHDFNNLLVGIMGNAELIQMMGEEAGLDFINQRVSSIHESAEKAADISRNMLAYAGRQPIERRVVDLNMLIPQFEGVLSTACLPTQSLQLNLADIEMRISIDQTMAERAILNLVKNASQFSPADGTITVSTRVASFSQTEGPSCFGESTHRGDFALIEITDFGCGITADEREHIFEPFYSTRSNGRGLGLAVVYGFIKSHNGIVECTSSPETSTCFCMKIPLVTTQPQPRLNPSESTEDYDTDCVQKLLAVAGKTVLIIDDDPGVVDLCEKLLEMSGWRVIVAVCGKDGLEKMIQHQDEVHCVLLDIVMPDMSAGEVLNEIEARKIPTPVVLISGFSKIQLESYYARPNVTAIITKPFRNRDILAALYHAATVQEFENSPDPSVNHQ